MFANYNSCSSVKGNDLDEPENILFYSREPNFKGKQNSYEFNADNLMHPQDLQSESDINWDEAYHSQDSSGSNSRSSFEASCEDLIYNAGGGDGEAQPAPSQKLSVLKKNSAREMKCKGLFEALADSMEILIEFYYKLTGILVSSFKEDLLNSFAELEAKDKNFKKIFKKKFNPKKTRKWEDKDAITKSIGSFIKKFPILLVDMEGYFPKRNHSNRSDNDFFVAYLKVFMLEFIPIFLVEKRKFEEGFDSLIPHSQEMMVKLFLEFIVIRYPSKRVEFILDYFYDNNYIDEQAKEDLLSQKEIKPCQNVRQFIKFSERNQCLRLLRRKSNSLFNNICLTEKQKGKIHELFLVSLD
ncbi:unnamed protein product [Moneuplotes crassus]|uniref:Uncharacterized protein n=1 Tax=Euplotes crassus TaxID=5936 RepID=A0AAD1UD15_EUPCR|nr:unnamed protein product [Moneuplotes crassus]